MRFVLITLLLTVSVSYSISQEDSLDYKLYRNQLVLHADLGFKAAPFNFVYDKFPKGINSLKFRHNIKPALGIGMAYKWFAMRIGFGLPIELRPVSRYGRVNFTDFGIKFNIKRTFWDLDFRSYSGYVIRNAYKWNDTLTKLNPHDIRPKTRVASMSLNCWYFKSKQLNMHSVFGIRGDFKNTTGTWYYKSTVNIFGLSNSDSLGAYPILPIEFVDTNVTKTSGSAAFAFDLGCVPGYAYVKRKGDWQAALFGGLGAVIQAKSFQVKSLTRTFIGLAPRLDMRFIAGYSKPKYFVWLVTDFDIKSISFQGLSYRQTYYNLSLVGGYRFKERTKKRQ